LSYTPVTPAPYIDDLVGLEEEGGHVVDRAREVFVALHLTRVLVFLVLGFHLGGSLAHGSCFFFYI